MANQYFTCELEAWRDGRTLHARMHYYRTDGQTYTYRDQTLPTPTMNLGGTTYSDTNFANRVHSGISVGNVYTTEFTREVSGSGNRVVTFTAGSGTRSDFAGTWSKTVYFPEPTSPPTGLSVSNLVKGIRSISGTVSVTGWGTGTGNKYRELQVWTNSTSGFVEPRRWQIAQGDSLSSVITVDNDSYTSTTPLTITPNTMYVVGTYATNGSVNTGSVRYGQLSTLPDVLSAKSATVLTPTTATVSFTTSPDGNQYNKKIQYSLDNSTWTTGATVTTGSAYSDSFTVSGLTEDTTNTIYLRVTTDAGSTNSGSVTVTTYPDVKFYGSVGGETKLIKKVYGSVGGETKLIKKIYGSANGVTKRFF